MTNDKSNYMASHSSSINMANKYAYVYGYISSYIPIKFNNYIFKFSLHAHIIIA